MTPTRILAALLVLAPAPALAAIARDGAINPHATAAIGTRAPVVVDTSAAWSSAGVPEDLEATALAHADGPRSNLDVRSHVRAHWDSTTDGTIDIDNTFSAGSPGDAIDEAFSVENTEARPAWTYQFTTTSDGVFDFNFNVRSVATDPFGLGIWDLVFSPGPGTAEVIPFHGLSAVDFDDSGTVSRALLAGLTYRVSLVSHERLTSPNAVLGRNATDFATFDWRITETTSAAPEPSAWALAIVGMGLAGATLRRRRSLAAA